MTKKSLPAIACLALVIATASSSTALAQRVKAFEVAEAIHVGGDGGVSWLTVDSQNKRLYLPRGTHTQVLDLTSRKVVADISEPENNRGVALDPQTGRGFISNAWPGYVAIFDLNTNAVLRKLDVDRGADAILDDPASHKVYLSCPGSGTLVAVPVDIDPMRGQADLSICLGGRAAALASDGQGRIYVNLKDTNQVAVIDSNSSKVVDKWSVAPGGEPVGMAIDPEHHRLFVGCREPQKLVVLNTEDGRMVADLPIGKDCKGIALDDGYIFASCADGILNIARETSPGKFEIIQNLKTRFFAKTMAVDHATHTIYLPTLDFEDTPGRPGHKRPLKDSYMVVVVRPNHN